MLSREDYRKIKGMSKEEMSRWLDLERSMTYNQLRKEFEKTYHDELDCGISNFLIAIAYVLHYNDDLHLEKDELASFMDDLFVSVDLFRSGEYRPEEYEAQLKEDGITFAKYDYNKLYRELEAKYVGRIKELEQKLEEANTTNKGD